MIPYCILVIEDDDDRDFMTALYINYKQLMYSEIYKVIKNTPDTEDVMQDVLEKLIDKISLLRSRSRNQLINYIISASKYTSFNFLRNRKNLSNITYEDYIVSIDSSDEDHAIELYMIKDEELAALRHILSQMDMRTQCLLEGYYILDKSMAELGQELGIKPESVRMSLTRARKKAFALLHEYWGT